MYVDERRKKIQISKKTVQAIMCYRGRSAGSFPEQRLVIEPIPKVATVN